ncbi:MAG: PQQ-binding-like beta-propeller repeat protein, partial [Planctomycetes bacterium]|nr:PQQ-binding-like beta-propeller repeat protein [Planctomycetota bacterium]
MSDETIQMKPLRLWPGIVIIVQQWFVRFVIPIINPDAAIVAFGSLIGGLAFVIGSVFFSRAPLSECWGAVFLIIVALAVTPNFLHESISTAGMGVLFFVFAIPWLCLAFIAWAMVSRRLSNAPRRMTMAATILFACGVWAFVRTGGITDDLSSDFAWRWSNTQEELFLAQFENEPMTLSTAPSLPDTEPEWPGFRGLRRDGIVSGIRIETNWPESPPVELWRRPIGPGWSSFSVHGGRFFTQEQRGENEIVACYNLTTGEPIWIHSDAARFWESNGGAGPRGTPTLSDGRVYSLGGTGLLNVLNAVDGSVVWSRDAASDTDTNVPMWGFSGSPLIIDDVVIVAVAGSLIAYDLDTGESRWSIPAGDE